jgi:hypothetical protein
MPDQLKTALSEFVRFARTLRGDEKGEAQSFLDHFFRALGHSGATLTFVDVGTGTLPVGTVFTVINNTSASPIAGTFSNLPNGSIFTSNGNNFKVNYTGGTGNDLTLKVVP